MAEEKESNEKGEHDDITNETVPLIGASFTKSFMSGTAAGAAANAPQGETQTEKTEDKNISSSSSTQPPATETAKQKTGAQTTQQSGISRASNNNAGRFTPSVVLDGSKVILRLGRL